MPCSAAYNSAYPQKPPGPPRDIVLLPLPEHFTNRAADLAWLLTRLRAGGITALSGMGGIGKTALASVAVHRLHAQGYFRDGIAVIPCQGLTSPTDVLCAILARFDPQRRQPDAPGIASLAETAHRLLDGKNAQGGLDNIEPALAVEHVVTPLRAAGATLLLIARHTLSRTVVPVGSSRAPGLLSSHGTSSPNRLDAVPPWAVTPWPSNWPAPPLPICIAT